MKERSVCDSPAEFHRHRAPSLRIVLASCLLALILAQICPQISPGQSRSPKTPCQWEIINYPTRNRLTALTLVGKNEGFIAEKSLMQLRNNQWNALRLQPPAVNIHTVSVANSHDIWVADVLRSFNSELFHYDGTRWGQIKHPFANLIEAMDFRSNGTGWISGLGELAHFDGKAWRFIDFPPTRHLAWKVCGFSATQLWMLTSEGDLFSWNGKEWHRWLSETPAKDMFFENGSHGFAVAEDKIFEWKNSQWVIHSTAEILREVVRFSVVPNGEMWGIGPRGYVIHYDGSKWEKAPVPTDIQLTNIQMASARDGWIAGEHGIVLHYAEDSGIARTTPKYGFELMQVANMAKEEDDEYGVVIDDLNNDGLKDIFSVCMYDADHLCINTSASSVVRGETVSNLKFSEEAVPRGITGLTGDSGAVGYSKISLGVGVADVDDDGDRDIYICYLAGPNKLFINNGKGYFRDVSGEPGRASGGRDRSNTAIFGDVNNDGCLDLFVTNEESSNRLYLGDGTGHFRDVTQGSGLETVAGGMGAAFGDIDGDGRLDLCVANWASCNRLYRNVTTREGGVKFVDITQSSGIMGESYAKSNAVVFADVDNDGDLDLFITERARPNRLYINDGTGTFKDRTAEMIGLDTMMSYGASFADFDNDGFLDLFVANVGECVLYRNIDGKRFVPATDQFGARLNGYCTGTATGDIDNDGDIDLYVGVYINGSSSLFVNNLNDKNFLTLDVVGTRSNRDAIGAKIFLYQNGGAENKASLLGYREINGGSGYGSQSAKQVHFGVRGDRAYDIVVSFPASGIKKILRGVASGQHLTVCEQDGLEASMTDLLRSLRRLVIDPDTHFELLKFAFVLLVVGASVFVAQNRYRWNRRRQMALHGFVLIGYWIQVELFLHERMFLSTFVPILTALIILSLVHLLYDRVIMARIARHERQATRDRIAKDLHDDIASTLSSALIYVDSLRSSRKAGRRTNEELLGKVSELLTEASESLTDIVWTMTLRHDSLGDLAARLRFYVGDTCRAHSLSCTIDSEIDDKSIALSDRIPRNVFLIFKEGLANVVKHADAASVSFRIQAKSGTLEIWMTDDGRGFSAEQKEAIAVVNKQGPAETVRSLHGHGLRNMKSRADEIGAELIVESSRGKGTTVHLCLKMT